MTVVRMRMKNHNEFCISERRMTNRRIPALTKISIIKNRVFGRLTHGFPGFITIIPKNKAAPSRRRMRERITLSPMKSFR
jgi:hypothetical protein